jgi:hypothetical protein
MTDVERRRLNALKRCVQFFKDNLADLNVGLLKVKFLALEALVNLADAKAADMVANVGEGFGATEQKSTIKENLRDKCSAISETAKGMEPDFDGISAIFRFRRNLNEADLLAKAMAFAQSAIAYEADFIAHFLPATFLADLNADIVAFETAINTQTSKTDNRIEAHIELSNAIGEGMQLKRSLKSLVRNRYAGDPGKIAAWESASHVEKAPDKDEPAPPTP